MCHEDYIYTGYCAYCPRLESRTGILLTCEKHLHGRTISPRREVWENKTSLKPPLSIEAHVPCQVSELSRMHVMGFNLAFLLLNFGTVPGM